MLLPAYTVNISNANFTSKIIKLHACPEIVNADPFIGAHDLNVLTSFIIQQHLHIIIWHFR